MEGTTTSGSRRSASRSANPIAEPVVRAIEAHLRARERRRDLLHDTARALRRRAQGAMARIHEGQRVAGEVARIAREARALAARVQGGGAADGGLVHDALQESVEAILLQRVVERRAFPSPKELGIPPEEYLAGLADLVGEVRRLALTALAEGALDEAVRHLGLMEAVYRTLSRFESPRAILPLKPKQDTARALVERTRGDVALAGVLARAGARGVRPEEAP
jgi:translin